MCLCPLPDYFSIEKVLSQISEAHMKLDSYNKAKHSWVFRSVTLNL